ncbi:hypothetical protein [Saccharibacillus kuerlensis]|uniref:ABC transporter permease n=1 Tax=Saccharibacillus kuerlensis TaxID=459527 RepID=A0ABQ2L3P1_9BACL|nr:hypothetical protein [Saccharibacillus kuerlensis]GGN99591.1 hypothetical protein GCM10010969_19810 [Saccharibacillus kuerlensis]
MAGTWRQAWLIVGREFKIDRYYVAGSIVFVLYMAFFGGMAIAKLHEEPRLSLVADLIFWIVVSMVGYYFSRRITKYITEDSYTQMLAYYRVMPISPQVIAMARCLQLILATLINGTLLFGTLYLFHSGIREQMNIESFIAFSLLWTGFGLLLNSIYITFELMLRGKAYFWYSLILTVILTAAVLILHFSGVPIVEGTIRICASKGLASPLVWILFGAGAASVYAAYVFIVRGIPLRDLA